MSGQVVVNTAECLEARWSLPCGPNTTRCRGCLAPKFPGRRALLDTAIEVQQTILHSPNGLALWVEVER